MTVPPLRPDGSYRHPSSEPSVRVYYRRDRECLGAHMAKDSELANATAADSGHGSIRRSTPLSANSNAAPGLNTGMSPYSTLGKPLLYLYMKIGCSMTMRTLYMFSTQKNSDNFQLK